MTDDLIARATDFYVDAIGNGHPATAVETYVGADYIQHNPSVPSGAQAFIEHFEAFAERNPDAVVTVPRGIRQGDFVCLHVLQDLGDAGLWATMDVFRFEDGLIVEHWDNLGRAQDASFVDGPAGDPGADTDVTRSAMSAMLAAPAKVLQDDQVVCRAIGLDDPATWISEWDGECRALLAEGDLGVAILEGRNHSGHEALWLLCHVSADKIDHVWAIAEEVRTPAKQLHDNGKFGFPDAIRG